MGKEELLACTEVKHTVFVTAIIKENHMDIEETEKLLNCYKKKTIGLKVYFDTTVSEVTDITSLREICEYARRRNLKVMVHTSNSPTAMREIVDTLERGDIITHAYHGEPYSCMRDEFECIKAAKDKGIIIDAGIAANSQVDFEVLRRAIQKGYLPDTIGTDITRRSAYTRGGRYGMTMCMSMMRELGMSEEAIFKAMTINAAKALGKEMDWGVLREGRKADVAVLDYRDEGFCLKDKYGNSCESKMGYRCMLTVCNGDVVYRD